jgi:hypothetical protein
MITQPEQILEKQLIEKLQTGGKGLIAEDVLLRK